MVKLFTIVCTLMVAGSMTFVSTILYESMGIADDFRYALLVSIALRVFGVGIQLALLCVLLKWILAGGFQPIYNRNVSEAKEFHQHMLSGQVN